MTDPSKALRLTAGFPSDFHHDFWIRFGEWRVSEQMGVLQKASV